MAEIKIDILVKPNQNCDHLESKIALAAKMLNIPVQIKQSSNFAAFSGYAINPSQTPIVIMNGNVEFAGQVPELDVLTRRLSEIQRGY